MRASITRYADALKRRKEETGESGFSLIELIVVVVILGILAAIAVPVFLGLQDQAAQSAQDSIAASAASEVAATVAQDNTLTPAEINLDNFATDTVTSVSVTAPAEGATVTLDNYCVTASEGAPEPSLSGPGC